MNDSTKSNQRRSLTRKSSTEKESCANLRCGSFLRGNLIRAVQRVLVFTSFQALHPRFHYIQRCIPENWRRSGDSTEKSNEDLVDFLFRVSPGIPVLQTFHDEESNSLIASLLEDGRGDSLICASNTCRNTIRVHHNKTFQKKVRKSFNQSINQSIKPPILINQSINRSTAEILSKTNLVLWRLTGPRGKIPYTLDWGNSGHG